MRFVARFLPTVILRDAIFRWPRCAEFACDGQEQVHGNDVLEPSAPSALREGRGGKSWKTPKSVAVRFRR